MVNTSARSKVIFSFYKKAINWLIVGLFKIIDLEFRGWWRAFFSKLPKHVTNVFGKGLYIFNFNFSRARKVLNTQGTTFLYDAEFKKVFRIWRRKVPVPAFQFRLFLQWSREVVIVYIYVEVISLHSSTPSTDYSGLINCCIKLIDWLIDECVTIIWINWAS